MVPVEAGEDGGGRKEEGGIEFPGGLNFIWEREDSGEGRSRRDVGRAESRDRTVVEERVVSGAI